MFSVFVFSLIPYCSSDAWTGNVSSHESGEKLSFHGSRIIDKVIEDLLPHGLYHAKHLLLAGSRYVNPCMCFLVCVPGG